MNTPYTGKSAIALDILQMMQLKSTENYIPGPLTLVPVLSPINLTASERKNGVRQRIISLKASLPSKVRI